MNTEESLSVAIELPPSPRVLLNGRFLATLAVAEKDVAALVLETPESVQLAASLQQRLTSAGSELEKARKEAKEPYLKAGRDIDDAAKAPASRIEAAKTKLKAMLSAWQERERKKAEAAEAARQLELARLEKIRQEEAAKAQKEAEEIAAKLKAAQPEDEDLSFDAGDEPVEKTETEKKIEAVQFAPAVEAPKPQGIAFKKTLKIKSVNLSLLPSMFITYTPNEAAIRTTFCVGWKDGQPIPVVPGVEFIVDSQPVSTGRRMF